MYYVAFGLGLAVVTSGNCGLKKRSEDLRHANNPNCTEWILDCLRYWALDMHVSWGEYVGGMAVLGNITHRPKKDT